MQFEELDLNYDILDALDDMNFTDCTPIQEQAIPPLLEGRDLIGVAQTGTGKTAAYLLPVLSLLRDGGFQRDAINCVIMAPTRELAQQIDQAMEGFSYYLEGISSVSVYGGNDGIRYEQEKRALALGADVVIATPGRLISHLSLGNVDLSRVSFFILDEADRMLDMGFYDDIMQIVKQLPATRQTIMFSATMPDKIVELAKTILTDPVEVKIALNKPAEGIHQSAFVCYEPQKMKIIEYLLRPSTPDRPTPSPLPEREGSGHQLTAEKVTASQIHSAPLPNREGQGGGSDGSPHHVIIFVGKKTHTKDVAITLKRKGYNAEAMHSDLLQQQRDDVMYRFKTGQIDILVATDIVARGIDIDDIQLVINYDVPRDEEDYVHRIGRTARAGKDGRAITLISDRDQPYFAAIERFLESEVTKEPVPAELGETPAYTGRGPSSRSSSHKWNKRKRGGKKRNPTGSHKKQKPADSQQPKAGGQQPENGQQPANSQQPSAKKKHRHRGGKKRDTQEPKAE